MPKLIILYPQPTDVATFERRYESELRLWWSGRFQG